MKTAKVLALSTVAIAAGLMFAPTASACDSCLNQSAVITEPAVIDTTMTAPMVLTQPAVINTTPVVADPVYVGRRHLLRLDTPFFGIHLF
ncbi:MAG TPA: hypothetical protein V6D22_13360 [Candidatus Obscuribacterales bacterium]